MITINIHVKMYVKILSLLIIFIFSCNSSRNSSIKRSICMERIEEEVDLGRLKSVLISSEWEYEYSFVSDTCFELTDFSFLDFPERVKFESCNDKEEIKKFNERLFKSRQTNVFFNIKAMILEGDEESITFPITTYRGKQDTILPNIKVYHQVLPRHRVIKKYNYYIDYLSADSLIIKDEKVFDIKHSEISGVRHYFKRVY